MKKSVWIKFSLVMVALFLFCAFGFVNAALAQQPQRGGILKLIHTGRGAPQDNFGLPLEARASGFDQTNGVIERLFMSAKKKPTPEPTLVKSWDLAPDQKSYTFHLRKGVKFHDGSDFNAQAVKWNLDWSKERKTASMKLVKSMEILDDHTIKLNLAEYNNQLLNYFCTSEGTIISPAAFYSKGKKWLGKHPIGTGAFQFVSFEKGASVKYKRFDGYWQKGKPYLDGVEWQIIKDGTVAMTSFQKGDANIIIGLKEKDALELRTKGFNVQSVSFTTQSIVGDTMHPDSPLANKKVLEAIEYAIDKKTMTDALGHGFWEPCLTSQAEPRAGFAYNKGYKGRPYNLKKAKQLMKEAGYPNGFKTKLIMRNPFKPVAVALQGYLGEIGIQLSVEMVDRPKWVDYRFKTGWNNTIFHSLWGPGDKTMALYRFLGGDSYTSLLKPPEYKKAIAAAIIASDPAEKTALTQKAIKILADTSTIIPLFIASGISAHDKSVRDWGFNRGDGHAFYIEDAWLSK
ncbi:MAG: ABC transporter substrate-binding protein [Deltaproteobacteria bacterium]|nr:ABC transporter substrate-binding protein [Deltaproteobacteria bacterium]